MTDQFTDYQHQYSPVNNYPEEYFQQHFKEDDSLTTKMEQYDSNLPPINDIFNHNNAQQFTPLSSSNFQPLPSSIIANDQANWLLKPQNFYKDISPTPEPMNDPTSHSLFEPLQVVTNNVDTDEKNGDINEQHNSLQFWYQSNGIPTDSATIDSLQTPLIYDQQTGIPLFRFQPNVGQIYTFPVQQNDQAAPVFDYQTVYAHSPSVSNEQQQLISNVSAFNQQQYVYQNDLSEYNNELFTSSAMQQFFDASSTSGSIASDSLKSENSNASGSPTTPIHQQIVSQNKRSSLSSEHRINRNGKIVKKVSQNCHANSQCSNCKTMDTTLWRRNSAGEVECNACNLYFRKNQTRRPIKLQKRGIMRRTRNPRHPYSRDCSPNSLPIYVSSSP